MKEYYVAFWNLENLFDVSNSPRRSDKLKRTIGREITGWTENVLNRKIRQLASIIMQMQQGKGPDLLGVCEIENDYVLKRLIDAMGPLNRNYAIAHHDMSDRRGIDVAFIYDRDLLNAEDQFSYYIVKRSATRDLFQVNFRTRANNLLVVIGNHWPSRSGGHLESEPYRIIAGETLAYFHERIRSIHGQNVAVIAMGDFNDEPYDRSLSEFALAERTRSKVTRARNPKFYNLMWDFLGERVGSHYYNNIPNVLDQFLVSKGIVTANSGIELVYNTTEIVRFPEMTGPNGGPIRFGHGNSINNNGFSDHFPISVRVREI